MWYKVLFVCIVLSLFSLNAEAQPLKVKKPKLKEIPKFELSLDYRMGNASIIYDNNGNSVSRLIDTLAKITDSTFRNYTFQHTNYSLVPTLKWSPNKDWTLTGRLAFTYATYNEKYGYDSNYVQEVKADFSMIQAEYFSVDADYFLLNSDFKWSLLGGFVMPFGFHNGQMNDPNYDFLSDGAFELKLGSRVHYVGDGINLSGSVLYNWRDEDLEPLMIYNARIGIVSVPGTELAGFFNYYMPLKENSEVAEFNPRFRALNEETYQAGVSFKIILDNDMFFQASYTINLGGINTFGTGIFNIAAGIRF